VGIDVQRGRDRGMPQDLHRYSHRDPLSG
jgi:hypothetical protein